jgi:Uma2 family endonuclease
MTWGGRGLPRRAAAIFSRRSGSPASAADFARAAANHGSRMLLTNTDAGLSTEPDAMFVSWKADRSGRVRLDRGDDSVEVVGTPDMVLEIVSPFSVKKDTEVLRALYGRAGVPEYWLVDARREPVRFDLLRHTPRGYSSARPRAGWVRSAVFGKSFRLTARPDRLGNTAYTLEVR